MLFKSNKFEVALIDAFAIICIVGALAFRFTNLDSQSLWSDELFSIASALDVGPNVNWYTFVPKIIPELSYEDSFLTWKAADNTPPLFEFLLIGWAKVFGSSDFSLRALPAVIGVLIPVIFYFGTSRFLGKSASAFGTIFLSFSPALIWYSQEVRSYILAALLGTLVVVWLVRGLYQYQVSTKDYAVKRHVWWGVLIMILLSYSHYTGLITAGLMAAIYLLMVSLPQRRYGDVLRFLTVPALISPWIYLSYKAFQFSSSGGLAWMDYGVDYIPAMVYRSLNFHFTYQGLNVAMVTLSLLFCAYWVSRKPTDNSITSQVITTKTQFILAVMLVIALLVLFAYSVYSAFTAKMWHPRYFIASSSLIALLFSLLYSMNFKTFITKFLVTVFLLIFMLYLAFSADGKFPKKSDYRSGAEFISSRITSNSDILLGWKANAAYYRHYLNKTIGESVEYNVVPVSYEIDVKSYCEEMLKSKTSSKDIYVFQNAVQLPYYTWLSQCDHVELVESTHIGDDPINDLVVYRFVFDKTLK